MSPSAETEALLAASPPSPEPAVAPAPQPATFNFPLELTPFVGRP
ncbi:MAG: hypothetical protein R2856_10135 [Caldilineaceae bacterium]